MFQSNAFQNSAFQVKRRVKILQIPNRERVSFMDKMHFRALDSNFNPIEFLDTYESMIWTDKYDDVGDFEVYGPLDNQLLSVLKTASYIFNTKTYGLMVIEQPKVGYGKEDGDKITIKGRSIISVLDRRVIQKSYTILEEYTRKIANVISDLITEAFGPTNPDRYWNPQTVGSSLQIIDRTGNAAFLPANTALQFTIGDNLLDTVFNLCKSFGLGIRCEYSDATKVLSLIIYEGRDMTGRVIFSDQRDNLISGTEEVAFSTEKNTILVTGNAEDPDTKTPLHPQLVTENLLVIKGLDRKETFAKLDVDPAIHLANGTDQMMTSEEYIAALSHAGWQEIKETKYRPSRSFEGEIIETTGNAYTISNNPQDDDFSLGDFVAFQPPHGLLSIARLDGITFSDDESEGSTLAPSFRYIL